MKEHPTAAEVRENTERYLINTHWAGRFYRSFRPVSTLVLPFVFPCLVRVKVDVVMYEKPEKNRRRENLLDTVSLGKIGTRIRTAHGRRTSETLAATPNCDCGYSLTDGKYRVR